ncbi:hypothetical protein I7I53_00447 [Histoplasma capsulatum var. duboisii H88]|uniref:Uncharacterized protein n=1 Tax=Ajellomyces capsulatus (strain H88) TaxID=544711 RepID=A0A8A1LH88_AJEC8|nr:hypothetical protein I7I53_00447 [Histoplasma capsulatum var. duboisii H88]
MGKRLYLFHGTLACCSFTAVPFPSKVAICPLGGNDSPSSISHGTSLCAGLGITVALPEKVWMVCGSGAGEIDQLVLLRLLRDWNGGSLKRLAGLKICKYPLFSKGILSPCAFAIYAIDLWLEIIDLSLNIHIFCGGMLLF